MSKFRVLGKDVHTTYIPMNFAKTAASQLWAGASDAASSAKAAMKVGLLDEIAQAYFQAADEEYDGSEIELNDVKKAILYAMGKKGTKATRRAMKSTVKTGLQVAGTATGATVGSIVPVAGTAVGGVVGGASLTSLVTPVDMLIRTTKYGYKKAMGTQGVHRSQAAASLYYYGGLMYYAGSNETNDPRRYAALEALIVLLDVELESVMANQDLERIAKRLKSV
ncbi:MAG: hypothetical protein AAFR65_00260 [Pseudomonadota bacterium]